MRADSILRRVLRSVTTEIHGARLNAVSAACSHSSMVVRSGYPRWVEQSHCDPKSTASNASIGFSEIKHWATSSR